MKLLVPQVCELGRILRHLYSSVVMLEESSELCIVSEIGLLRLDSTRVLYPDMIRKTSVDRWNHHSGQLKS